MTQRTVGVYDQAELYAAAFEWPVANEIDWLLTVCPGVSSVVEPFCGQARFAEEFSGRGIEYVGLDRCPAMLRLGPSGDRITLVAADATDFDLGRRFDLAWCPINSLCHLAAESPIVDHFRCVHRHLAPGAAYVIEIELCRHDGPWEGGTPDRSTWTVPQPDGSEIRANVTRENCDLASGTCTERAIYQRIRGDTVLAESNELFTMRMWTFDDLLRLSAAAGFEAERVFRNGGSKGRPEEQLDPALENDGENHYFVLRGK